jgi:cell division protein FtsB
MAARLLTLLLAALALLVQADLWLGKTSQPYVWGLQSQLTQQQAANDTARNRNARITAEVNDLKEGLEMVEEKARGELGMVKADEILVQLTPPR